MNKQDLIDFENGIVEEYKKGLTLGPVHLSGGNEEQLIKIFENIKENDWVFSTHRSHYHALLKSKDKEWLAKEILSGFSSHINSKKHKIFTSSIVGGCIPIALGTAFGIRIKGGKEKVWCFVGDMASEMGFFHEAVKYATNLNLPVTFIIEDNGVGCNTPTDKCWGNTWNRCKDYKQTDKVIIYNYERTRPHYGIDFANTFIKFHRKKKGFSHNGGMF